MMDPPPPAARAALAEAAHAHASLQSPDSCVASPRSGHSDIAASATATLSPASMRRSAAAREATAREGSVERLYVPPLMPVRAGFG